MKFGKPIKENVIVCALALLFVLIAGPRMLYPDLDHGDEWADAELLISGANFAKFGFLDTCFLPVYEAGLSSVGKPYTHYPALTCIISGAIQAYAGITSLRFFRGVGLLFSLFAVLIWYFAVRTYTQSRSAGFLFSIFYMTNPYFIYGADGLGQLSFSEALRAAIILLFILAGRAESRRRFYCGAIWTLFFVLSLMTFEYTIYLALFFVLYKFFLRDRDTFPSWGYVAILCSAPVAGFLLHFAQNACYFNGVQGAFEDFRKSAADRILHSKDAPMPDFGIKGWWTQVILRYFSGVFIFNYFLIGCISFFCYLMYQAIASVRRKKVRSLARLLLVLTACGLTWYVAFPAHSFAHMYIPFLYRHIVPVAALAYATALFEFYYFMKQKGAGGVARVAFCALLIAGIGFSGIVRSDLPLCGDALTEAKDFLLFKKDLLKLKSMSDPGDIIGVNYYRRPFISYYTDRQTFFAFDSKSLQERGPLPRYFLFLPFNHQATGELYAFLQQKYRVLFASQSRLFPVTFFELNP